MLATKVAAGSGFSLVLMEDSKVYSWGNNTQGACGHGGGASLVVQPNAL
jgi:alpha-tubulin suppressor-like RCC1 family protein